MSSQKSAVSDVPFHVIALFVWRGRALGGWLLFGEAFLDSESGDSTTLIIGVVPAGIQLFDLIRGLYTLRGEMQNRCILFAFYF